MGKRRLTFWVGEWPNLIGYKGAFLLLLVLQTVYFSSFIFYGHVVFPHDNSLETGCSADSAEGNPGNRKFSDISSVFIPELQLHLNGNHQAWLATWNPNVQLGRPAYQMSGLSRVWLVTNALGFLSRNPLRVYSILTILTVALTGWFFFFFLKACRLHPLACLTGGAALSLGIFISYWLCFIMFLSTVCWSVFLLWLTEEVRGRASFRYAPAVGFGVYSLVLSGYPQFIILNGYLLAGYAVTRFVLMRDGRPFEWKPLGVLLLGVAIGLGASMPVLADLWLTASRSSRLGVDDSFFLSIAHDGQGFWAWAAYLCRFVDPFWAGNPIDAAYPSSFEGISLGPVYAFLLVLGIATCSIRRTGFWLILISLCITAEVWKPAYQFAVDHLGFHFSRIHVLGGAVIPSMVICSFAVDRLLRRGVGGWAAAIAFTLTVLALCVNPVHEPADAKWALVCLGAALAAGSLIFAGTRSGCLLLLLITVSVVCYGKSMILSRHPDDIRFSSRLVEELRKNLLPGERYAKAGAAGFLPPNQEVLTGLRSVHSYDSLSSRSYQAWARAFSRSGASLYGRHLQSLDVDAPFDADRFACTGVGCIVASEDLKTSSFEDAGEACGARFYRRSAPAVLYWRSPDFELSGDRRNAGIECRTLGAVGERPKVLVDRDDHKEFAVATEDRTTLLFLSQQHHPQWMAYAGDRPLQTVLVNGFYQGVLLPPGAGSVALTFRPASLWGWAAQVFFVITGAVFLTGWVCRKGRRAGLPGRWPPVPLWKKRKTEVVQQEASDRQTRS